jgi:hypothetical protein
MLTNCKKNIVNKIKLPQDTIAKHPDTVASGTDTLLVSAVIMGNNISHFQYDDKNRLIHEVDSASLHNGEVTTNSFFSYDAQGNLTKREISDKYGDTVYNIAYANGTPVSADYIASFPGTANPDIKGTIKYTVTNNKVTEIDGSVYPSDLKIKITYNGNNIASISVNGSFADPVVNYKYGSKKSPYAASRFKWFLFPDVLPLVEWPFDGYEYPVNLFNQNDLESLSAPGRSASAITFTNQYNNSGYPMQIIGKTGSSPQEIAIYHYDK